MNDKFSIINIRETQELKQVRIGSKLKPVIISDVIVKWQSLLDLIVKIIDVPAGLIMKLNEDTIEVFLASNSPGNPYKKGEKAELIYGLYCETVIGTQQKLLIPDATKNPVWRVNNPDVDINMVSYLGFPVNWPDGEVFGTICILDNKENNFNILSEELLLNIKKSLEAELKLLVTSQELEEKNAQLEQLISVKDKFFSIIAHDLKSPFNSIMGFSDLLVEKVKEKNYDGIEKYAAIILNSSQRAINLLMNLMEWSRSQTGRMEFIPEYFEMVDFINEMTTLFDDITVQKSISIKKKLPPNAPVFADKAMISTVMRNLISNAIKFTHTGGEIIVSAKESQNELTVSISDNGVGISKANIEKIFRIDENFSTPGTNNEKGTGLGLILCKEFVEKNGGKIWVESEEGGGSIFSFTLPLQNTLNNSTMKNQN